MVIALVALTLVGGGYAASQLAAIRGNHSTFALQMDQTPIRILASVVFVGAILMAFLPDHDAPEGDR